MKELQNCLKNSLLLKLNQNQNRVRRRLFFNKLSTENKNKKNSCSIYVENLP